MTSRVCAFVCCAIAVFLVPPVAPARGAEASHPAPGVAFSRTMEPREKAFSLLVPRGWGVKGGLFRVNPLQAGGPLNSVEAKCDLTLSGPKGKIAFRIHPDIVYAHVGIGGGLFPPGANYQGARVRRLESAQAHLKSLFEANHRGVSGVTFLKVARLGGEVAAMDRAMAYTNRLLAAIGGRAMTFRNDAAAAVVQYAQGGVTYKEVLLTGIVDMRAALTWKNTRTLSFRAPAGDFERWRAVFDIIRASVRFNPRWVLKEAKGQKARADFILKVFDETRRIDDEILRRSRINREEIMNDNYLVLTGQEEYRNPHTGKVELDTDAYRYRWTNALGDRYYTDREDDNPNHTLKGGNYKRTPVRKRRNEP